VHTSEGETAVSYNPMFLYAGEYESVDDAKADLDALKEQIKKEVRADAKEMERAIDRA
jgi:hypothetical protein